VTRYLLAVEAEGRTGSADRWHRVGHQHRRGNVPQRKAQHRGIDVQTVDDAAEDLVRASSNKPELVVVESPASEARMREMFRAVDAVLRTHPEVGEYNQTI